MSRSANHNVVTGRHSETPTAPINARADDPWLGVHVLTEFLFCPRAGLLAFESKAEDRGEDERPGRLDYLPRYVLQNIEDTLNRKLRLLGVLGAAIIGTAVVMSVGDDRLFWPGVVVLGVLLAWSLATVADIVRLTARRMAAQRTDSREPQFDYRDEPQPIDWWPLRNAGFTAKRYEAPLEDEGLKPSGKPYLVLSRGDERIPVFRQHRTSETLYQQHFARIAAYCRLITRNTGYSAPYGVILFGTSYQGVAVRNSPFAKRALQEGLATARATVRASRRGREPDPAEPALCAHCPLGRPTQDTSETLYDCVALPMYVACDAQGEKFHSACGDRFRWLPPHERAQSLRLSVAEH